MSVVYKVIKASSMEELREKVEKADNKWMEKANHSFFKVRGIVNIGSRKKTDYQALVECGLQ